MITYIKYYAVRMNWIGRLAIICALALTFLFVCANGARADAGEQILKNNDRVYEYSTNMEMTDCNFLFATVSEISRFAGSIAGGIPCDDTFPNALNLPAGVKYYMPNKKVEGEKFPLVIITGGIFSIPGNYNNLAASFARLGYAVFIPYDIENSYLSMPLLGLTAASAANKSEIGKFKDSIEFNDITLIGHSAGGAASGQLNSVDPSLIKGIEPTAAISSVVLMEPGPVSFGGWFRNKALILTGEFDTIAPSRTWRRCHSVVATGC